LSHKAVSFQLDSRLSSVQERFVRLPVAAVLDRLLEALGSGHAVLSAPTGSGKTTLAPLALLASPHLAGNRIIMLEPRRIAARAAAARMSEMLGEPVGATVGYRTRLESRVSSATRIEVVTEGVLIRRLQRDPELAGCGLLIFDEFHERSLQADLGLALSLDLCQLRDDLRLLVMSATLDTEAVCRLLDDAPLISASGSSYPVAISHLPPRSDHTPLHLQVVGGVLHAWHTTTGDLLAFLPGAGEIHQCRHVLARELPEALILPLYGNLGQSEQDRIFRREAERRRIILATPIAETSLTIDNISSVVDSGYYRRPVFDHSSGLTRLGTFRISKASAAQRAGRAGRLGPGHCFRLWNSEVEHSLLERTPPEIIGADLSPLVLELALWGVTDPLQLRWLDPPRPSAWQTGCRLLQDLALLDGSGRITALGRTAAALPVHPRLGVILVRGAALGLAWTSCMLAALLSERDIVKHQSPSADLEERLRILARFGDDQAGLSPEIDKSLCRRLLADARGWLKSLCAERESRISYEQAGNLLAFGYPDRIAALRPGSTSRYLLAAGSGAELHPADPLLSTPLLVIPQLDARAGDGRIFLAAPITEDDLQRHHPQLLQEIDDIHWDDRERRVKAERRICLGNIVLHRRPLPEADEERVADAFLEGVRRSGVEQLPWNRESRELQARICSLHLWQPGDWPSPDDNSLLGDLSWLAPYCSGMRSLEQLRGLDLKAILLSLLSWQQQQLLDKLAPTHLQVPSGSRIRLAYTPGESPVLAVRLQELFGLTDTPRVCAGRVEVLLHLLSPARRPLQVTADLRSFWTNTYPLVRKELAGRYPKHYWPEDPFAATATSGTKKQMLVKRG